MRRAETRTEHGRVVSSRDRNRGGVARWYGGGADDGACAGGADPAAARSHSASVGSRYVTPVVRLSHDTYACASSQLTHVTG